jgi:predicted RNA-binding protein Jag
MAVTKKNQAKPIRLSLSEAAKVVWLVEDLATRALTPAERRIIEPLVWQVQLVHAQIEGEFHPETPARDIPLPGVVDK